MCYIHIHTYAHTHPHTYLRIRFRLRFNSTSWNKALGDDNSLMWFLDKFSAMSCEGIATGKLSMRLCDKSKAWSELLQELITDCAEAVVSFNLEKRAYSQKILVNHMPNEKVNTIFRTWTP